MPYCEPSHIWHPFLDIDNGTLLYCAGCASASGTRDDVFHHPGHVCQRAARESSRLDCPASVPGEPQYLCTLDAGHPMPHEAHGTIPLRTWSDEDCCPARHRTYAALRDGSEFPCQFPAGHRGAHQSAGPNRYRWANYGAPDWCDDCDSYHGDDECPTWYCYDCDARHDDGEACPGWYCEDCSDYHAHGDECPSPYCSDCDDYHAPGECPEDDSGCNCEAPRQDFSIRNDGEPPLASGTRAAITLPAGVISKEGLTEIGRYLAGVGRLEGQNGLRMVGFDVADGTLGDQWQTKTGNFTKRLSRYAYQNHDGLKVTPEVLSQVGCIARDHSKAASFEIDVTRDLNAPAADFYHSDSCWWGSYGESRCALKSNGGFGLRSFGAGRYGDYGVTGRVWVMPLRLDDGDDLVPTFNTDTPDAFVVFNGYGDLAGYAGARIMAAMAGWSYTKIDFDCEPMYVNSGGYLIAAEQTLQGRKQKHLHLTVRQHSRLADTERELAHVA